MSIFDEILDDSNYYEFKKQNKLFILGVTDSTCPTCCQDEPLLGFMQENIGNGTYSFKGKAFQIARIDLSIRHSFIEREKLDFGGNLPKVFIGFEGKLI